jgi:pyruvate dehydrogenase E1 component
MSDQGSQDIDPQETSEWEASLASVMAYDGADRASFLLQKLAEKAASLGITSHYGAGSITTPYANTISVDQEGEYPGNIELETKIDALVRWNATVMVARTNKNDASLGGHIGSFASSCSLYEVGQNHFFHAKTKDHGGDLVFFQGHVAPGMYSRSYVEGRFDDKIMDRFRQEALGEGLSSYPHPWLHHDYWQFPTVSMGLAPMQSIYQARFMKYLGHRGLVNVDNRKVWTFCGDGEMDEPESMGAITRAGREKLDNLIFVINCNLQRLDGLVNGNGKIIQELESSFRGAGWNVIKVVWGSNWQPLFDKDTSGILEKHLTAACDGDFQTYQARGGAYMREKFFAQDAALAALVADLSDDDIHALARGGHDVKKVYAAFKAATSHTGQPTVVLTKTVKGYGLGAAGESLNIAHNVKKLKADELKHMRDFFNVPITDKQVENFEQFRPAKTTPEMKYMHERRQALGGYLPERHVNNTKLEIPHYEAFAHRLLNGSGDREMSTTTAYVQILTALCKDKNIGTHVVPITPDESRTFGMEGLFRQLGIYNPAGQQYEPEDRKQVMYYKEAIDGQILQEGINEGGAFSSWMAAATSYSAHDIPMVPFYIYYSMFGFQRIADYAWAAGDSRARGFLLGATAGRTTLNGEGLQHEDGHSHIMSNLIPNCRSYDPTYAYELAVIIWHGLKHMYVDHHDEFFYITMMNENYTQRAMPKGVEQGIIDGVYLLEGAKKPAKAHVQLMGSGSILREVEAAAVMLAKDFNVTSDIWSVTSANELYRDGLSIDRHNRLTGETKTTRLQDALGKSTGPIVISTDYVRLYSEQLRDFMPGGRTYLTLGTDGFGRSDTRAALREHFEVDAKHVAYTAVKALVDDGALPKADLAKARKKYKIDINKVDPIGA